MNSWVVSVLVPNNIGVDNIIIMVIDNSSLLLHWMWWATAPLSGYQVMYLGSCVVALDAKASNVGLT